MATYAINNPPHAGSQIVFSGAPPANNDIAPCGSGLALLVVNPPANGNVTVSLACLTDDGLTVGPRIVTVPQNTSWLIPLLPSVYGGSVVLTYTGTLTTVQVAVVTAPGS
jgi:hypothetical protein